VALTTHITIRLRDQFTKAVRGMREHMGGLKKEMEAAQKTFQLAGNMSLAADNMERLSQKGQQFIRMFADDAIELEDALARVGVKTGTINDEKAFKQLADQARELGKTTTFTALEVASAQDFMAQAGMKHNEILAAAPTMLALSRAGTLDLASAADISTNVLAGMKLEVEDLGHAADVLAFTAHNANTDVLQMGEAFKYAGPIAANAGVSIEQLGAMMGVLGGAGVQASMAGTSVRAVIQRLVPTSKAAQKQMRSLGIEVADSEGNLRDIEDILGQVHEKTQKLSGIKRSNFLRQVFGERAAGVASILIDAAGTGNLQKFTNELKELDGYVEQASDQMVGPTKRAILELESTWSGFKDQISQDLLPVLRELMEEIKPLIADFSAWAKENPELVRTLAKTIIKTTALSAAMGPVIRIGSGLTTVFGGMKIVMGATGLTGVAKKLNIQLGTAGLAGKLGAAGLAGAAVFAGYQVGKLIDDLFGISDAVASLATGAEKTFGEGRTSRRGLQEGGDQVFADGTVMRDGKVVKLGTEGGPAPKLVRRAQEQGATSVEEVNKLLEKWAEEDRKAEEYAKQQAEGLHDIANTLKEGSHVKIQVEVTGKDGATAQVRSVRSDGGADVDAGAAPPGAF
jgi:TP901 family phage tail tape measure protein